MRIHVITLLAMLLSIGCAGQTADPGLNARLIVSGAQFVEGPLPSSSGGPEITSVNNQTNTARRGEVDRPLDGTLGPTATAVLVHLVGDRGHWITVAGPPSVALPDQPTFDVRLALALEQPGDAIGIQLAAVDGQGRIGPRQTIELPLVDAPIPDGELVVTLSWDRDADLDLRVVDPAGVEIFARNPNSAAPSRPGQLLTPAELAAGGALDLDSNARCVIDGIRRESVVWAQTPPAGRYVVRVDTPDMCGQPSARWRIDVRRSGEVIASAQGVSTEHDTRFGHDLGAGVLALTFEEAP